MRFALLTSSAVVALEEDRGCKWESLCCIVVMGLSVLVSGCAVERVRETSRQAAASGDYERALSALDAGLKEHPDSSSLRSAQIQTRSEASTRLLASVAALRAAGRWDDAQRELERARALDPANPRVAALLADLATDRRQAAALAEAEAALARQQPEQALRLAAQALKEQPRHAGLLALQRQVELELRQAAQRAAQDKLAETRPITLDFRDANLRTVLDAVSRSSGVNFMLDRDIRQDVRVTVYIRQARVEDALDLITGTHQLAKKVIDPHTVVIYPNTAEKQREYQEQIVRVFYLASAEAKGAAQFLRAMLKLRDPFVDERSNMLALRDTPENIQLAERLIALYDTAEPEVLLEVEVIEISRNALTELGVKLPNTFSLTPLPPGDAKGLTLGNIQGLNRERLALGLGDVLVNLRREVGDYNTLANPRIRVRNREKAKILIGDKIPVITTTTSGNASFVSDSVSYLDVGLKLDVEPTIYADDDVAIRIGLEVSTLGTSVKTSSGTLAYQIGTRNATTMLRLHDGETQLLAGLISREDRSSASRVPGVGDLPVLGRLFSNQADTANRTELVLAITPRVLRNVRRPTAPEAEMWVGTDAQPRWRVPTTARAAATGTGAGTTAAAHLGASAAGAAAVGAGMLAAAPGAVPSLPLGPAVKLSWQGPAEVAVGDTVELHLMLDSTLPLRGLPIEINYDKHGLQLVDLVEADYFRREGAQTSYSQNHDAASGQAKLTVLRSQATGAQGSGPVYSLRFKARQPGLSTVQLSVARPLGLAEIVPPPAPLPSYTLRVK